MKDLFHKSQRQISKGLFLQILPEHSTDFFVMRNEELAESLLGDYLLNHPPHPFQNLVGVGSDPTNTRCLIFREPGTLHDLVISTKFVPEPSVYFRSNLNRRTEDTATGTHWEHALFSGMAWRQETCRDTLQTTQGNNWGRSRRYAVPLDWNQERIERHVRGLHLPHLIIAATFTNLYGLELVAHVEESSMEGVQHRLSMNGSRSPFRSALQYMTILGQESIYRWQTDHHKLSRNMIGFLSAGDVDIKDTITTTTLAPTRLSLDTPSKISERTDAICFSGCHPDMQSPSSQLEPKNTIVPTSAQYLDLLRRKLSSVSPLEEKKTPTTPVKFRLDKRQIGGNNRQSDRQMAMMSHNNISPQKTQNVSPYYKLPFAPSVIASPNPLGPFAPPYQCWHIQWENRPTHPNAWYNQFCYGRTNTATVLLGRTPQTNQHRNPPVARSDSNLQRQLSSYYPNRQTHPPIVDLHHSVGKSLKVAHEPAPLQQLSSLQRAFRHANPATSVSSHTTHDSSSPRESDAQQFSSLQRAVRHERRKTDHSVSLHTILDASSPQQSDILRYRQADVYAKSNSKISICGIVSGGTNVSYHQQGKFIQSGKGDIYVKSKSNTSIHRVAPGVNIDSLRATRGLSSTPKSSLIESAQGDIYAKSKDKMSISRIDTGGNVLFDKYNTLGLLFDENKDCTRDRGYAIQDSGTEGSTRICKSEYHTTKCHVEQREPPSTFQNIQLGGQRQSRERRAAKQAIFQQNEGFHSKERVSLRNTNGTIADGSVSRRDSYCAQRQRMPSKGDIALNLLCPYQHSSDHIFEISHETPDQQAFRHRIECSSSCRHLMGRFVMELLPERALRAGVRNGRWTIRKAETYEPTAMNSCNGHRL